VAVVGYGYWGPNLARNFMDVDGSSLIAICDERAEKREVARSRHPGVQVVADVEDIIRDEKIQAVAIATPISTHADIAVRALRAGKHVLVEKPLAGTVDQAIRIVAEAQAAGRTLMVDHTFVYMGAVRKVKELIDAGDLGDLYYVDSVRVNLGLFQRDASVIWDLAVHDLSIMAYWVPASPIAISCVGVSHVSGLPYDIAYLTVYYPGSLIGHIHVNWLSPIKVRRTLVAGSHKTILFDDLASDEKIKVYSRGVTRKEEVIGDNLIPLAYRRTGDIWIPQVNQTEALRVMADHFIRCCLTGERPLTGGREGLQIVRMLEAAERSVRQAGTKVSLDEVAS
jgi:predicted dehydrogenase